MPKIILWIDTGFAGCDRRDVEYVDDAVWAEMSEEEREEYLEDAATEYSNNYISCGAYVADEGEDA